MVTAKTASEYYFPSLGYLLWPGLFSLCLINTYWFSSIGYAPLGFNITYFALLGSLLLLERYIPYERSWQKPDGQIVPDIAHTLLSKGMVQIIAVSVVHNGIENDFKYSWFVWPHQWSVVSQIVLSLIIAEFGLYWAHRLGHEWRFLWRFHAVHHSVRKLWCINTGRFHVVDTVLSFIPSFGLLYFAGCPLDIMIWYAMITPYIGLLSHSNIPMKAGFLSYIFNTPELHRWHHMPNDKEGNTNYGENLMLFDLLFGTFYLPQKTPPTAIGITDNMPRSFWQQLAVPFCWKSYQRDPNNKPLGWN